VKRAQDLPKKTGADNVTLAGEASADCLVFDKPSPSSPAVQFDAMGERPFQFLNITDPTPL
jgi:hypothetical protein